MKKILFLFAALSLLLFTGCKDDDNTETPKYSIVGVWKPVKLVETSVPAVGQPLSESFDYSTCQQDSRWTFNDGGSGNVLLKTDMSTTCVTLKNENLSYNYDAKTSDISISYVTFSDKGKVLDLTDKTMNLKIERSENGVYESETYTLVRVK